MSASSIEIITCSACGTKNRVRRDLPPGTFRCGVCQTPLSHATRRNLLSRALAAAPEYSLRFLRGATALTVFGIPVWVSYIAITNPASKTTATTSSRSYTTPRPHLPPKPTPPPFLEPELRLPENGEVVSYTDSRAVAPFEIKSDYGTNYLVKLTKAADGEPVQTIFVRGGSAVEVEVPSGTFHVKYAAGQKWYGYKHLFGPSTSYSRASQAFTFAAPGRDEWNAKMLDVERRLLSMFARNGLSLEVAREVREAGFEQWHRWNDLKSTIARDPKLIAPFNSLMAERRALQGSRPTRTTGYTITLYKVRDGNLHTQPIDPDEF